MSFARPRLALRPNENLDAAIPVEQARGPVLLIAGEDDGVWPSSMMAGEVVSRLRQAHFAYQIELLKYPHAGHRAGQPAIVPTWHGSMRHPVSGRDVTVGGNPKGDAESSLDAIPRVLAFLHQSLGAEVPSNSR